MNDGARRLMIAALGSVVAGPTLAADEAPLDPDRWRVDGAVYVWGAAIGAETTSGDDIQIDFAELFENLNFGAMGTLEVRKGKWAALTDLIYLNVEGSDQTTASVVGLPVAASAKVNLQGVISTTAGGYQVLSTGSTGIDLMGGVRYLWLDTDLAFDIGRLQRKTSQAGSTVDGIIAVRGRTDLTDRWYLSYYADVGTGQSDFTWQALGTVNYSVGRVDLAVGYRYLRWNLANQDLLDDLDIQGPMLGVRFSF
ncbi:MAG: hypothetical protein AAFX81_13990 [Pseudomonadota bacterium]